MNTEKEKGLSRANENSPMPNPEHTSIISAKPLEVKSSNNPLRLLRTVKNIPAKDLVETVQQIYPGYDKMLQSKCENGDKYGIELRKKALDALLAKYSPETLEKVKHQRNGRHRLKNTIMCRLEAADYDRLLELIKADGFETMQAFLTHYIKNYITSKETKIYDTAKADRAQKKYCKDNGCIMFAPDGGICPSCHKSIYRSLSSRGDVSGYSVQYASRNQITGCPHCHRSFVE